MSAEFKGRGNLGTHPVIRHVTLDGAFRAVLNLRVYFDRPRRRLDGTYEDHGGFWMTVSVWDERAEQAARLLRKGARVYVEGALRLHAWEESGEARSELRLESDYLALDMGRLQQVGFRERDDSSNDLDDGQAA
ncbi:MAG: single-stranded DNA-binding protein [Gammaproteobacteria bacterium]|nr:single-stranded DNA-binding protein [Gammaproteobacteria bacterium]